MGTSEPIVYQHVDTLEESALQRLFGDSSQDFDLYEGTVRSASDVRIIYLSSDVIRGIYEALSYEAGEAWGVILRSCGLRWGTRVSDSLGRELQAVTTRRIEKLTVGEYVELVEQYFARHGWGSLKIDLSYAETAGVVRAEIRNSIFATVLADVTGPVNQMLEGMLAGLIGGMAQQPLGCIEVRAEEPREVYSEFFVSGRERIDAVREKVTADMTGSQVLALLKKS